MLKYKAWKLGRQEAESRELPDGSVIIKSKDLYFLAKDSSSIPVLINKDEGERLWNHED
jgi:hypothetical protein